MLPITNPLDYHLTSNHSAPSMSYPEVAGAYKLNPGVGNLADGQGLGSITGGLGQAGGALSAAASVYDIFSNWGKPRPAHGLVSGASAGAYLGTELAGPAGTAVGAVIGGITSFVSGLIHVGKHKDQIARDHMRAGLQALGLIDGDFKLQLADGSSYDIGLDGGYRYPNVDGSTRRAYEVDFSNPLTAEVINLVHPLSVLITGNNQKLRNDLTGYLVNAALSNASDLKGARANVQAFYAKLGVQPAAIAQGLSQLTQSGQVSGEDYQVFMGGLQKVFQKPSAQ